MLLLTGTDSPVNADSSTCKDTASKIRASAGTKSPASILMISPGTSSLDFTVTNAPSRYTFAFGVDKLFKASSDFSALLSCQVPRIALIKTTTKKIKRSANI